MTDIPLICLEDGASLVLRSDDSLQCRACAQVFPRKAGVYQFLHNGGDAFYEGAYLNRVNFLPKAETWLAVWPLWFIRNGLLWEVRKRVLPGSLMIELGCAGGVRYFGRRYRMVGADLSLTSLSHASSSYALCLQVDARRGLPLAPHSVDAVVSSFFWEHLSDEDKLRVLKSIEVVLKPGGLLINLYDVETRNPLIASMRARDPARYQREFLDQDGHLGYRTMSSNRRIFEAGGFEVIKHVAFERTWLLPSDVYIKLGRWPGWSASVFRALAALGRGRFGRFSVVLLRVVDETVGRWFPSSWGRIALTVCRRVHARGH